MTTNDTLAHTYEAELAQRRADLDRAIAEQAKDGPWMPGYEASGREYAAMAVEQARANLAALETDREGWEARQREWEA